MGIVRPGWIQRHPVVWGLLWASASFAVSSLMDAGLGRRLPNLLIAVPTWAVAGLGWGYFMKWNFDRKADRK
jgi:hypothetical protein